jgi:acyl transferase domain-containing protein/NAD(P)H-dependent flavin oxidoreductase YrpB (nitropropane dioxygenase family)/NAD(P)-dependent dehydrogenase (short-subunit alcohol dehydrogenase family)
MGITGAIMNEISTPAAIVGERAEPLALHVDERKPHWFEIGILPPGRSAGLGLVVAAGKAGELGILKASASSEALESQLRLISEELGNRFGLQVTGRSLKPSLVALEALGRRPDLILISGELTTEELCACIRALRRHGARVFREVISEDEAVAAVNAGVDGLVAKGNEAPGRVGAETLFVLLQRLCPKFDVPVWAFGGIGPHAAAACRLAGAQGIVLQDEVSLSEECELSESFVGRLRAMDGTQSLCLGESLDCRYRAHRQEGESAIRELQQLELSVADRDVFSRRLEQMLNEGGEQGLYPMGQGIAFAGRLAARHRNVGGILRSYRSQTADNLRAAASHPALVENSPFAREHGIRWPIFQGPMTRVSDVAAFADAVSKGGALPFLALALLREAECERLLSETAAVLQDRPWGVGILAFAPAELRAQQLKAIMKVRPPFAILAGGRPEQANVLEAAGIRAYLHTPSANLLEMFLRQGARRFIFEGRECGGHVGPLSSFILWHLALDVLLEFQRKSPSKEPIDIVFAGGIHDARSAAMVSAFSSAASAAGIRVGVLIGTAYLFTRDAVETQAILPGFQEEAVRCQETVLLDMDSGHAIRVTPSAYAEEFKILQRELRAEGRSSEEARARLEEVNVGRLRLASKGLVREAEVGSNATHLRSVSVDRQKAGGLYMMGQVAALRDGVCTIEELHQSVCDDSVALLREFAEPAARTRGPTREGPEPIAIVGMACHLPGAADLAQYWSNIIARRDSVQEVPADRWPSQLFYSSNPRAPDRSISKWGGFVAPMRLDPTTYGIPPNTLASVEPLHLMMLEVTRKALADAGYDKRPFPRESTSVVLGIGSGTWDLGQSYLTRCLMELELNRVPGLEPAVREQVMEHIRRTLPSLTEDSFPGILGNVAAGRLANRFDLGGPNLAVDAACASSLAALETGLQTLWRGTSDVALVGATEAGQSISYFLLFSKTGALSPRGRCRPFDATADGIAISEGLGMLVLKRLSDAERDGDRIYSVIRSIGSASDGRDKSLTAPAVRGQARAVNRAYAGLEFPPSSVELVEAHGTGTVVGDRTELETLGTVLQASGARRQSCALGSVKSQIGHTKGAAGIAALLKVSLSLHQRLLPPTLVDDAAPALRDRSNPLYLNTRPRPWFRADGGARRAGVSSFGFGGANYHAVLEEYGGHAAPFTERSAELFVFRAASRAELAAQLRALERLLEQSTPVHLVRLADVLRRDAAGRRGSCRLAMVVKNIDGLPARLSAAADKLQKNEPFPSSEPTFFGEAQTPGQVAFLFPGQGSQYLDMMDELALSFPLVREVFERADRVLDGVLPTRLTEVVFPPPAYSSREEAEQGKVLNQTWFAQPALGAAGYAMYALLKSIGIGPDMVAGHSYGEYAALCAAGALSFADLIRISEQRGRVVQDTQGTDAVQMLAVQAGGQAVSELLANIQGVAIAGVNAPDQTIVGGRRAPMEAFRAALDAAKVQYQQLAMSAGFHIPEAQPAADRFAAPLAGVTLKLPSLPVYSNLEAAPYPSDVRQIRNILLKQLTQPLRFQEEVEAMYAAGVRVFVETGPGQVLSRLVRQILGDRPATILATNRKGSDSALADYWNVVGWFYAAGGPVRLDRLSAGEDETPELAVLLKPEEPVKPAEWIVTGGGARPMLKKKETPVTVPVGGKTVATVAINGRATSVNAPQGVPGEMTFAAPPASVSVNGARATHNAPPAPAVATPGDGHLTDVVTAFQSTMQQFLNYQTESNRQRQELMSRFLDTQRAMVEAFATGGAPFPSLPATPHAPPMPTVSRIQPPAPPPAAPLVAAAVPNPAPQASPAPSVPPALPVQLVAEQAPAAPPRSSMQDLVLELISERTGYPPEILQLDQNLESDLGIDSIKRAEIFGGLLERLGFSRSDQEREEYFLAISKLRTLREVMAWLNELAAERAGPAAAPAPVESPQPPVVAAEERPLRRFLVRAVEEPLTAQPRAQKANEVVLLIQGASNEGREAMAALSPLGMMAALSPLGVKIAVVRHGSANRVASDGVYEGDLSSREGVSQVRDWMLQKHGAVTTLCHFLPLDCDAEASVCLELKSLNNLAAVFGPDLRSVNGAMLVFTAMGGRFGFSSEPREFRPGAAAIALVLKCLSQEWPEVFMKSIDIDPHDNGEELLHLILAECASNDRRVEVGYSAGRRFVLKTYESELDVSVSVAAPLDESSVVLVTGGARGITAEICQELAARFQPTFILVGRSPAPEPEDPETIGIEDAVGLKRVIVERRKSRGQKITPSVVEGECQAILRGREIRSTLDRLAATGARTEYHAIDVRDSTLFESLIQSVYERHGRIDGVIHGAGIVEDIMFDTKSPESFQRVFDTKVQPALVLVRCLRQDSLRFLFFLSSLAGRYGYAGGTDYSSANAVLNQLARKLDREWKAHVTAIGWGPWESVGIATRYPPDLLTARGVEFHSLRAGVKSFIDELTFGAKGAPESIHYVPGPKAFPE